MNFKSIKTWAFGFVALIAIAMIAVVLAIKDDMNMMYGAHTELVDHTQFKPVTVMTAVANVSVLSPDGQRMLSNRTVLWDQGKIVSITEGLGVPEEALIIDGRGKFLIPGLIDSHAHLQQSQNDLLLYVANGVTHIRDLAGSKADLILRKEIENGRIGPRMFVTSPQLNTVGLLAGWFQDFTRPSLNIRNSGRVEAGSRSMSDAGYDALKLYMLDVESFRAFTALAEETGMPTVAHLPMSFDLSELKITKVMEIAHIEEIVKLLLDEFGSFRNQGGDAFRQFVESRSDEIVDDLFENDITINSVLWFMESIGAQAFDLESFLKEVELEYANPGIVEGYERAGLGWLPGRNQFQNEPNMSAEDLLLTEQYWAARADAHRILLKAMGQKGVKIVAGTDASANGVVAGFSLHDELLSLNRAGLSPAQTLLAATAVPAKLMNSNAGVIAPGYRADLVLLTRNPLVDIENTSAIDAVVLNGGVIDRSQLDAMLDAVRKANDQSRTVDISQYN